jgi:mRNA interferase RelE/StbE
VSYRVEILDAAVKDLRKLDPPIARRVLRSLERLAERFEDVDPQPLSGDLSGLFKLRIGSYRLIYEAIHESRLLVVHAVAHRRDVYRSR